METTNKRILNKLIDYSKECIKTDIPKDIIIDKLNSYRDKIEIDKLKEVIDVYFSIKYEINSVEGIIVPNVDILHTSNKCEALKELERLRERYNTINTTKETITITQTDDDSAEIEVHCTKDFFISSIIEVIKNGKHEGILDKSDLECIFNAIK